MIAPHPFGRTLTPEILAARFESLTLWEDRYRQIILLARELPALSPELKQQKIELAGCENQVWLGGERLEDGTMHYYGDSDGRIVKGLLAILLTASEGKTPQQIMASDPLALFQQLNILEQLSSSRASGLNSLAAGIKNIAQSYL
ncbi:cysteine desulfurase sulfur acceptor subunit CsdE [Obesumbacterium proteus]|uniref:cysteine desulfurase sulfur acceptor subunit CsdE n=1 Tax=Obesumbacterium proteus TaxID=82983 RepID=UPI00242EF898|nr:cysteine desulfurase sulfur acceptor subunit CsdE [Obesumbacterium proteus]